MKFIANELFLFFLIWGDLKNEEEVLDWILSDKTMLLADEIEEVNEEMLDKLVERYQLLAAYFCKL